MKLRYMGTAALERLPAIFCNCHNCRKALAAGGKNIMTRSQALLDDTLLIDLNSETYSHFLQLGKTMWDISHILITHGHCDHFTFEEFCCRTPGGTTTVKDETLKVYASEGLIRRFWSTLEARQDKYTQRLEGRLEMIPITCYVPVDICGYTVTPLPASHADDEEAFVFLIEKDGKTLFYGNDTGYFGEALDDYLVAHKKHIHLLSLDCTKGDTDKTYNTHMSMSEGRRIADRFLKAGIIDEKTLLYYTHFTHHCGMIYDELVVAAKKYGFEVAHDGLDVIF